MFKKVLVANRGEVAVRIIHACREMGIRTVALFTDSDKTSLHIRIADECTRLNNPDDFMNADVLLNIARTHNVDAIHPGIGFMAEIPEFIDACKQAGITFIGPTGRVMAGVHDRVAALEKASKADIPVVEHSQESFGDHEMSAIQKQAEALGYPLVIKSCRGGRGSGERWARSADKLAEAVRRAQVEAENVYGDHRVYMEKGIYGAHQIGVQIVGDHQGNIIHLGEREGSIIYGNRKVFDETPSPALSEEKREALLETAIKLARMFNYDNVGTVEFLIDEDENFYFTEFKPRIQTDHAITEMVTGIDLVQLQIKIAAGQPLPWQQGDIRFNGHAMMCRIQAEDTTNNFLPSPGKLTRVRIPAGNGIRVDTYVYCECVVPEDYSRFIGKLTAFAPERDACIRRLQRACNDFLLIGTHTNLPLIQRIIHTPALVEGNYDTTFTAAPMEIDEDKEIYLRNMAVAAALFYVRRNNIFSPSTPSRLLSGWHRSSRRLPQ